MTMNQPAKDPKLCTSRQATAGPCHHLPKDLSPEALELLEGRIQATLGMGTVSQAIAASKVAD